MSLFLDTMMKSRLVNSVIPTLESELERELWHIATILDVGCGPSSPISRINGKATYTEGVEAFQPYYEEAQRHNTHSKIVHGNFFDCNYADNSFEAVVLTEVIEHCDEDQAMKLIAQCERIASKKVIITTPNGLVPQSAIDGNELQEHLSGWLPSFFIDRGYKVRGLAGPKFMRREIDTQTMAQDISYTMRFKPRKLFFVIAAMLQSITFYFPAFAFGQIAVLSLQKHDQSGSCPADDSIEERL